MGPVQYGVMQFEIEVTNLFLVNKFKQSNPPNWSAIPQDEILGVTAIIISVSYKEQEFFRVGYYVYNTYSDQELIENPPEQPIIDRITRNILADKPRITRFAIRWGDEKDEESGINCEETAFAASLLNPTPSTDAGSENKNPFLNQEELGLDDFLNRSAFGGEDMKFFGSEDVKNVF